MKAKAYQQYLSEANNWLHRGRSLLLKNCLNYSLSDISHNKFQILEVGAGSGHNIEILSNFGTVDAVEIESTVIKKLAENPYLNKLYTEKVPFSLNEKYDIICVMDFLEHIEDDHAAFDWIINHLKPNGLLFVTVPAFQWFFSFHDVALGHCRRYNINSLLALNAHRLKIIKKGYFNCFLFPLAFLSRLICRMISTKKRIDKKQSSAVPTTVNFILSTILKFENKLIQKFSLFPFGLTVFTMFKNSEKYHNKKQNKI